MNNNPKETEETEKTEDKILMKETIDTILTNLDKIVKAKTKETVRALQKEIEDSIKKTGEELKSKFTKKGD